jgi:hypothetical protein
MDWIAHGVQLHPAVKHVIMLGFHMQARLSPCSNPTMRRGCHVPKATAGNMPQSATDTACLWDINF